MASKKLKQHCEEDGVDDKPNTIGVDRISELPDPLHTPHPLIPSHLSCCSNEHPFQALEAYVIIFEEFKDVTFRKMVKSQLQMFFKFVHYCLKSRKSHMQVSKDSIITKFKLDVHYHYRFGGTTAAVIDSWLKFAVKANVEELDLCIEPSQKRHYCLPHSVLNSLKLTILKLESLRLEIAFPKSLPGFFENSVFEVCRI